MRSADRGLRSNVTTADPLGVIFLAPTTPEGPDCCQTLEMRAHQPTVS